MNVIAIEDFLNKINSVFCSRLVLEDEDIREIHVVSNTTRHPKQVARDIQSVLLSQFNITIDHKIISIAQIDNEDNFINGSRLKIDSVEHSTNGNTFEATVILEHQGSLFAGTHKGLNTTNNVHKVIATATLNALSEYCDGTHHFILDDIYETTSSGTNVLVSLITTLTSGKENTLCGANVLNKNNHIVAVQATLDAVNRVLTNLKQ